ncbi:MAG: hypothetical protein SA339_11210 [Methanomassiliicoccus sp.]|nr:hypothetical protein [Methanomassiliicoccus sp.]
MGVIEDLVFFLEGLSQDPFIYSIVFFLYAVAATVFLPIPVEVGLFFSPETPVVVKALVLGAGKAVGSIIVFTLGDKISGGTFRLFSKWRVLRAFMNGMRWFVAKTRYFGLYIILSIPLMVDTVPIYLFSLFNQKGLMNIRYFALTNFFAGVTRATIVYLIFWWLGLKIV